jgi:hypothetical protein
MAAGAAKSHALSISAVSLSWLSSTSAGIHHVVVGDHSGANPVPLASQGVDTASFSWAPNGTKVGVDGDHVLQRDGSSAFTLGDVVGSDSQLSYSGTGLSLLFTRQVTGGTTQARLTPSDGGLAFSLAFTPSGSSAEWPISAPDDSLIAFDVASGGAAPEVATVTQAQIQAELGAAFLNPSATPTPPTPKNLVAGSHPSFSADSSKLAYVTSDAAGTDISVIGANGGSATALTTDGADTAPAWSPDGTKIAFVRKSATGTDVWLMNPDGSAQTQVTHDGKSTAPGWKVTATNVVTRVAGSTRIGTAIAASQQAFAAGQAKTVVLTRSDTFADALGGGPLGANKIGPLLLTGTGGLDPAVATEIKRVLPSGSIVYVLGGTAALPSSVDAALNQMGYPTQRIGGTDRFDTSVQIAKVIGKPGVVFLTTGLNFPDALSAGAAAGSATGAFAGAVLLTADNTLPAEVDAYIQSLPKASTTIVDVGGQAANAEPGADLILAGADRYATSADVAASFFGGGNTLAVGVASGANFPDALAGGAILGPLLGPLLLTPPDGLPTVATTFIDRESASVFDGLVFGGAAAISDNVVTQLTGLVS